MAEESDIKDTLSRFASRVPQLMAAGKLQNLKEDEPIYDPTQLYFWLGNEAADEFLAALDAVRTSFCPRHVSEADAAQNVWSWFYHLALDEKLTNSEEAQRSAVDNLVASLKKSLFQYEVAITVEYLNLDTTRVSIGQVEFFTPDQKVASEWGFEWMQWWQDTKKQVGAISLGVTTILAADADRAQETAKTVMVHALDALRVAAMKGIWGRTYRDELLLWRFGRRWAVRQAGATRATAIGMSRGYGPLVTSLDKAIEVGVDTLGLTILLSEKFPSDVRARLLRAIRWMSYSVTHEGQDDKIIDLCTALETMLLPEYKGGNKGLLLAIHYTLLGGTLNPPAVRWFYQLRNHLVHGSSLQVVGIDDVWHLRSVCYEVIKILVTLANGQPQDCQLSTLIATVLTPARLDKFIYDCDRGVFHGSSVPTLKEAAIQLRRTAKAVSPQHSEKP